MEREQIEINIIYKYNENISDSFIVLFTSERSARKFLFKEVKVVRANCFCASLLRT